MVRGSLRIVVIGGGAAGVLATSHLQDALPDADMTIVEPRAVLGAGVAYSTTDPTHLLNVRADWLSAWPQDPGHFRVWAADAGWGGDGDFLPRARYGRYLRAQLGDHEHVRSTVTDVELLGDRVVLRLADDRTLTADRAVLAVGPVPASWPAGLGGSTPWWVEDPWAPDAVAGIDPERPVVLIGTGLTAVDVALSLRARGAGRIVAVSRHGFVPAAHDERPLAPASVTEPATSVPPTARALLSWARQAETGTGDWRSVVDGLRPVTNEIWSGLAPAEQRRLVRHVHRRWEVLRHRMAPPVAAAIAAMRSEGQLRIVGGGVRDTEDGARGPTITLEHEQIKEATVVNCTGGTLDVRSGRDPLLRRLLAQGLVQPGPLGMGIDTDDVGRVASTDGRISVIGPLRRGRLWETTAIPEIRDQAAALAGAARAEWRMVGV